MNKINKFTPDYQRGYQEGYQEGQNKAFEILNKQIELAYLSRPIVLKIEKKCKN